MPGPQSQTGKTKVDREKGKTARRVANRNQREADSKAGRPVFGGSQNPHKKGKQHG